MSFPTYINFQVNNTGGGRSSNMVVHSHAVILMLLSLFPETFGIFYFRFQILDFSGFQISDFGKFQILEFQVLEEAN